MVDDNDEKIEAGIIKKYTYFQPDNEHHVYEEYVHPLVHIQRGDQVTPLRGQTSPWAHYKMAIDFPNSGIS
jgi:hypothetical protein